MSNVRFLVKIAVISGIMTLHAADFAPHAPRGLQNLGNSCYMNSAIQALYQTVVTPLLISQPATSFPDALANAYYDFATFYTFVPDEELGVKKGETGVLSPSLLYQSMMNKFGQVFIQQDAAEGLLYLINSLEGVSTIENTVTFETVDTLKCDVCHDMRQYPVVRNSQMSLSLPSAHSEIVMIDDLLKNYLSWETLSESEAVDCVHCRRKQPTQKITRLQKASPLCMIALKRFEYTWERGIQKNTVPVGFPLEGLEMIQENGTAITYNLKGIVLHRGSLNSGHYIALVNHNNSWYECNDENIRRIGLYDMNAVTSYGEYNGFQPYILFYEQHNYKTTVITTLNEQLYQEKVRLYKEKLEEDRRFAKKLQLQFDEERRELEKQEKQDAQLARKEQQQEIKDFEAARQEKQERELADAFTVKKILVKDALDAGYLKHMQPFSQLRFPVKKVTVRSTTPPLD